MKNNIVKKLRLIDHIWRDYILSYKVCSAQIKFTEDVQSNYLADITFYFEDTLDIIFQIYENNNAHASFLEKIGLLQSIYIQQDFVEELLYILRCKIEKGDLKQDSNYTINRDIRNEFVGHPIRKEIYRKTEDSQNRNTLLSSTIYSTQQEPYEITYVRYHRDNNYKFEVISPKISDIVNRHVLFLNQYFDIIIGKLKKILIIYQAKIKNIQNMIDKKDFSTTLKLVSLHYEFFLKSDFCYEEQQIFNVYNKRNLHPRYQLTITNFIEDLEGAIKSTLKDIEQILNPPPVSNIDMQDTSITINIVDFSTMSEYDKKETSKRSNFNYELGKLATKRSHKDFDYFSHSIFEEFANNGEVQEELKNMKDNLSNDIEYYCSLNLLNYIIENIDQ